jgi:hypothetical protein
MDPTTGPLAGGTLVTVTGTNFLDSATMLCRFGTLALTNGLRISSSVAVCPSPAGASLGTVPLAVSNNAQDYVGALNYLYIGAAFFGSRVCVFVPGF